ncbi:hypothetical protein TWF173_009780 [Orbilia oligospora]|uniref:Vezatin n=2 Tax=Orbilia oligospora TaxID=2813651 RepID=G1X1M5_ARTOA|nr:hypothetical protein AOL_s00007g184 [Orbilia oligospora ATCC 24927]EGX52848.1 hypothetical protein AOL_s00007g184 [Orbilia oligospora ATCC 24927]KAF3287654.1 hypothetical protein TWF970_007365 [Orbilia oligospora]KAF3317960.1 hypothetical protein TWF173_009780 [Orbilia oligospora]
MEALVFRDTPLAQYLEGEGEPGDWSIDPSDNNDASSSRNSPNLQPLNFAPSSLLVPKTRKKALRPLQIQNPGWYQNANLKQVMSGGLKSRLAAGENLQFVERFRYILVASQLLNEQASVANYDGRDISSLPTPSTAVPPADNNPFTVITWFGSPGPRFYAYTAASIIILSILISYLSRGGSERKLAFGKSRAAISLMLSMVLALLVFAHLRRKKLRHLRTDAISAAEQFVENCQMFDVVVGNAITLIQEIELVSRGYRLSQPLPPITRLERADNSRKCARLRRTIAESFKLTISPTCRAIEAISAFPKVSDLEKFYDVYDIHINDLHDASFGIDESEFEDMESLKSLKALFQRLYTIRKIFVCHLLALEANGGHRDHTQWHAVGTQLYTISRLMGDLAQEARSILTEETDFKIPSTPIVGTTPAHATGSGISAVNRERLRQQLRKFNGLSTTVRGLQAKMHLLREGTDKALQSTSQEPLAEGFGPELLSQYDEIGVDLRGLLAEWESGRASLANALDKLKDNGCGGISPASSRPVSMIFSQPMASPGMSQAGTLVGASPRTSGSWDDAERDAILRKRISVGSDFLRASIAAGASDEEEIFEGMSDPTKGRERSKLTREERIAKMKEDRQKAMEARRQTEANISLVRELRDVLESRVGALPSAKRRSLPAARSRLSLELIKVAEANRSANGQDGRLSAPITPATIAPVAVAFPPAPAFEDERTIISPVQEVE